ncbi:hypothetical protein CRG98_039752 [Punica granatum]|uniref:ADP-ribosyl cyclase/cyclic ADP-ribose hydrolase n=1 Tax=Punica granatum TaxID=22663 RepID=A0A2I0I795_PUNGR|nr:hypothetical protein CRG98_039752 [Punica granatum]
MGLPYSPRTVKDQFEVFLSFRGPDSRQGLADVLYSEMRAVGIRVFRDDDELEMGDEIGEVLVAIETSRICVLILSKTFAASTWCLREVERMVELRKLIIPIFYTAGPDDVKLSTGLFKKDLKKHEKKHGKERVKKWEDSLKAVAMIKGREVKNTGYVEFSKSFVGDVQTKLKLLITWKIKVLAILIPFSLGSVHISIEIQPPALIERLLEEKGEAVRHGLRLQQELGFGLTVKEEFQYPPDPGFETPWNHQSAFGVITRSVRYRDFIKSRGLVGRNLDTPG